MTRNPTHLIVDSLSRDPVALRDARRRLTLRDDPADLRERIARALNGRHRHDSAATRNARLIRTHSHLGALRRDLVLWAAQHAPREISGYRAMLAWALAQVDWTAVIRQVELAPIPESAPSHRASPRNVSQPALPASKSLVVGTATR